MQLTWEVQSWKKPFWTSVSLICDTIEPYRNMNTMHHSLMPMAQLSNFLKMIRVTVFVSKTALKVKPDN